MLFKVSGCGLGYIYRGFTVAILQNQVASQVESGCTAISGLVAR